MWKVITFDRQARESVFAGIEEIAELVSTTMWPYGYNVILDNLWTQPDVTNDWVSIVRTIDYEDRYKNIGALMLKKAADRTNRVAGDGTSTTTILTSSIIKEWLKFIDNGVNPFKLSKHMTEISNFVIEYIKKNAVPVTWRDDIFKVASISAQDKDVGKLIADAYDMVWNQGTIVAQESKEIWLSIEMKKWLEFDSPIESIALINNDNRQQCELINPYIFVTDKRLNTLASIKKVLDSMLDAGDKDILLIVDDIDPVALATLIYNKNKGIWNVGVVKAPHYATLKENFFRDVCALTGAVMVSHKTGLDFDMTELAHCWRAEQVISWRMSTIIVGWNRNEDEIKKITDGIQESLKREDDQWNVSQYEARLAKLNGWIATIRVWYPSDIETTQKRLKIEDALQATKSALQEWVIGGEGISLIEGVNEQQFAGGELGIAYNILQKALQYPMKVIVDNGGVSGDWAVQEKLYQDKWMWYDFESWVFVNLIEKGIIDPVKVVRVALENAVSLANMILTSRAVVTEDPEKKIDGQDFRVS